TQRGWRNSARKAAKSAKTSKRRSRRLRRVRVLNEVSLMNGQRLSAAGDLVGRLMLASLFVTEAIGKLVAYGPAGRYMAAFGVPEQLLPAAVAVELGGGLMIMLGLGTRFAAAALGVFCVAAAVLFHSSFSDRNQLIHFEKDLALAGAFL